MRRRLMMPMPKRNLFVLEQVEKVQAGGPKNVGAILDPNLIDVDPQGRIENKSDVLEHIQAIDSLQYEMEAIRVKLHKDTAIVTGLYGMKGVERGRPFARWVPFLLAPLAKRFRRPREGIRGFLSPPEFFRPHGHQFPGLGRRGRCIQAHWR